MFNSKATREQKAADRVKAAILKFQRKPLNLNRTRFKVGDSDGIVDKWQLSADKYNEILAEVYKSDIDGRGWRINSPHDGCDLSETDKNSGLTFKFGRNAKCTGCIPGVPSSDVEIRYRRNCLEDDAGKDTVLILEYVIMRSLMEQSLDVSPKVFSLSAPAVPSGWEWD
jgi:hypothetical protein